MRALIICAAFMAVVAGSFCHPAYGQENPDVVKREVIKTGEIRAIRTMQAVLLAYIVSEKGKPVAKYLVDWARDGFRGL